MTDAPADIDRGDSGPGKTPSLVLRSTAFESESSIPTVFTCEGNDVSPPLTASGVPDGAESLALLVDDPDAPGGTFTHWILFNIPPTHTALERDLDVPGDFEGESRTPREGTNDFGNVGYGGPCPPEGHASHRYVFQLHALDTVLDLDRGASRRALASAMDGHVLGAAELVGTFRR